MRIKWSAVGLVVAGMIVGAVSAAAHHAFSAEFDAEKPMLLTGTVTKTEWVNPHSWIYLDVKGDDGTVVNWAIETGPPNALIRRGWNRAAMPVGSIISVDGYAAKDGSPTLNAFEITFPDGRKVFAGTSGTGAPRER